jgi:hypothetical protein
MARSKHLHRIAIYLKRQNPVVEPPAHFASRTLTAVLHTVSALRYLDMRRTQAQLLTSESWKDVKARFRMREDVVVVKLKPELDYYGSALAAYPPVPRNERERVAQEHRWMAATKFAGSI